MYHFYWLSFSELAVGWGVQSFAKRARLKWAYKALDIAEGELINLCPFRMLTHNHNT